MVRTADDVRRAVAACLYPPEGIRGFGPRRPSEYGRRGGPDFCREANARVLPVVQVEHIDAVENIDEILAVPGLASIAFGPNDLAGSMGLIGQPRHPNVLRAIDSVIARSRQASVPVGISVGEDPGTLVEWASWGVNWLAMGGDISLMLRAAAEVAGRVREQVAAFSAGGPMKITRIETLRLPEHPQLIWVQLHTSDGLVGLGETYHVPGAVEAVIHDYVAPLLLGQSAFDRERHWQTFFAYANFFGHAGAEMRALSALDIALWDLLGQHVGQPIYNLIGGRCRDTIPIYNTCVNTPKYADQDAFLERPRDLARSLLDQGITPDEGLALGSVRPAVAAGPRHRARRLGGRRAARESPVARGLAGRPLGRPRDPQGGRRPHADRDRGPLALGPELCPADRAGPRTL